MGSSLDELFTPTKRYIFGSGIPYYDSASIQVDWAVKELGKKKIAFINQWGPVGETNIKGAEKRLKKYGLKLAIKEKLKNIKMDYSGLVAKMKTRGIECVVITTTAQWTIPLLKEIERQDWKTEIIIGHSSSNIPLLNKFAGTAMEGVYVTLLQLPSDYDDPFMNRYRENLIKYGKKEHQGMYNCLGYGMIGLLLSAIEQVGPDLSRERLIDTMERWKNYDTGFLGKFSYSPTDHIGGEGLIIAKVQKGKAKILVNRAYPE